MILAWCTVIVFFVYTFVLVWHAVGYIRYPASSATTLARVPVTIVVCARNEEKNIGRCLEGILSQNYPSHLVEVILVNDGSDDQTVAIAKHVLSKGSFAHKLISNASPEGKKRSLKKAIELASHDFIVTRDADTFVTSEQWLNSICYEHEHKGSNFIIGPIKIADNFGLLWALQAIETQMLQLFAIGAAYFKQPYLCSGANLAFSKHLYMQVKGYESHLSLASGDDVLLLESIKKLPEARIAFVKQPQAIVQTYPEYSFRQLLYQKVRWAGKHRNNPNPLNLFFAAVIFAGNFMWLLNLFVGFIDPLYGRFGLIFIIFKLLIDILLLFLASFFLKNKHIALFTLPVGFIYPLHAGIVAIASLFIKPKWKEN